MGRTAKDCRDVIVEGEALALDTPIPTPGGWSCIGALKPGDKVFSGTGCITEIVAVSPVWEDRPCYSVKTDGAAPIVADARHKWVTSSRRERRPGRRVQGFSVRSTEEIGETLMRRATLCEHELPIHGALSLNDVELPVPPYTLGAWLGDGDTRGHGTYTCHPKDSEILDNIRADGFDIRARVGCYAWGIRKLRVRLRAAGVIGHKHIPYIYLRASRTQRLALMRGLMDTDGYVSARGQCAFDNTNERLVRETRELALTLGFKPGSVQRHRDPRGHLDMFRITFTCATDVVPFALKRKAARCIKARRPNGRLVREVEPVESVPVRCIQVAHATGTFLAGVDFVVTHNSGILAISPPWNRPIYEPSKCRLTWPNGCIATTYTADEPDALRGPQHDAAWCDELASWAYTEAWDNLAFGLRLGDDPRVVATTTPRPTKFLRGLIAESTTRVTRGTTFDNIANLAPAFIEKILAKYQGTRLGRQELEAAMLDDAPGALWHHDQLDRLRVHRRDCRCDNCPGTAPEMRTIVVSIDPAVTSGEDSNETGIITAGVGVDGHGYIFKDLSGRFTPDGWGRAAVKEFALSKANRIVAEVNQGGDLVESNIKTIARDLGIQVFVRKVHAARGKRTRAEPVSSLYEQGRVHHVGQFSELEDSMCTWEPDVVIKDGPKKKIQTSDSPDRLDAMVWAITDMMIDRNPLPAKGGGRASGQAPPSFEERSLGY